jgi:hypothetical protein
LVDHGPVSRGNDNFATEIIDPAFYKKNFSHRHRQMMDEVLAPWCLGETVKIDGISYDPMDFTGLLFIWSRSTYKSTMMRLCAIWFALYMKLRKGHDARQAFIHQVISKALEHSESIREVARNAPKFRECFPEFAPRTDVRDWDEIKKWRWPNYASYSATEFSFFLAMPTMVGAFAYDLYKNHTGLTVDDVQSIALGFVVAFISGVVVVRYLLDFVSNHGFALFAWWRILVGGMGLGALFVLGAASP